VIGPAVDSGATVMTGVDVTTAVDVVTGAVVETGGVEVEAFNATNMHELDPAFQLGVIENV